ncbi:MAG: DUF4838 domain-containing protein, partial [Oscillospiraceae bacterium]|nr:DUF4838 domain-containing protein [Oscillospiraceae bacterium]
PRDLFSAQPEWFRMDEHGNRVNDYHFCHSNPEALEYISERSVELAKVFAPTTHRYNFWVDDGTNVVCHCPKCKETGYSDSDAALNIYNAMLAGIRSVDSKAQQCYLAYFGTSPAPMKIKPAEGIFLEFAPMNRDPFKSLHDPTAPPDKNIKTAGYLDELLKTFGTKNAKVLDYWLDNSWNSGWKKPVKKARFSFDAARDDIAFYNEMGIEAVTTFACFLGEEYYELYGEHADILGYANAFHT